MWALGLRNPFRMTLRPGTGSHNPADGNPGEFTLGDVGYDTWEETDIVTGPGRTSAGLSSKAWNPPPGTVGSIL